MEEEVNKEYIINILKYAVCAKKPSSSRYPLCRINIPKKVFYYLNQPKELTFLLDFEGKPKLSFPTIDSKIRGKIHCNKNGDYSMSIKTIEDSIAGKYYLQVEGDNIILTKVEDERPGN